ncbi:MAG: quinone oxidoreductase family protein [Streptosporangiaceae bacterium]
MNDSRMTRAVVATAYGGPEVLSVIETPVGAPGADEVLISVRAAATNPIDYKVYSGAMGRDPARLPMRLGSEAAGVVTAVADGVEGPAGRVQVGDEVVAYRITGGYAADVLAPASSVIAKPSPLSFEQASGMMLTGVTAVHALTVVRVSAGETVLVYGASGGVGLMAIQLAAAAGARVIGTASPSAHALVREFGAEPVTYGAGLEERVRDLAPDGIDAAVDLAGGDEALDTSLALVADRDRIVTALASRRAFDSGIKVIGGAPGADPGPEIRAAARLELARLAEDGKLRVIVAEVYPLAQAAGAHRELATGHAHGKIVLVP